MPTFDFDETTRFSLLNSMRLAEASDFSYQSFALAQKQINELWGFKNFKPIDNKETDTQGFICSDDSHVILAFRGSQTSEDWQTDFNTKLVNSEVGLVHWGFKNAIDSIWDKVEQLVDEFQSQKQSLWVTGHSLGGALATLAVDRLTEKNIEVSGMYTFGQPRVGDKDFAENFDDKIKYRAFRFVNDEDIVTRVPPRVMGYEHIGTVRFFDYQGKLYKDNIFWNKWISFSESATVRCSERYSELRQKYPNGLEDHSLQRYKNYIRKNLIKERGIKGFEDYLDSL